MEESLTLVTRSGVRLIAGAEAAGVTIGRSGKLTTVAATSELCARVDAIQYELRMGPCVDAAVEQKIYRSGDLRTDARWPRFGQRAAAETGVLSMLSFRMLLDGVNEVGGINFYATKPDAFADASTSVMTGLILSTHAAVMITANRESTRAANLEQALENSRNIGTALGILMASQKITQQQAFDLLRVVSQQTHRKVHQLALDVIDTGTLELPELQINEQPN